MNTDFKLAYVATDVDCQLLTQGKPRKAATDQKAPAARRLPDAIRDVANAGKSQTMAITKITPASTFKEALKPQTRDPRLTKLEQLKQHQQHLQQQQQLLQQQLNTDYTPPEGIVTREGKKKKNKHKGNKNGSKDVIQNNKLPGKTNNEQA